ncbi:MAG: hypothetical protein Q7J64_03785 [Elusimicrobiota bacterium]|nr:hypothetical protein [Elusimicrobiota bacterium]
MSLRVRADDGTLRAWAPAAPPRALIFVKPSGRGPLDAARARSAHAAIGGALTFLGYESADAPSAGRGDLTMAVGAASPEAADFAARGFSPEDFHYYCLKTHLRAPLAFSWEGLDSARADLEALRGAAQSLSGVTLEGSSRGVTGYLHRFREALSRDFDFPEALSCVWDGLRPGALSPGSKAAFLRAALPALGLENSLPG